MNESLPLHPDRSATTLAVRQPDVPAPGGFALPGAGSADARVTQKLLWAEVEAALASRGTDAARARLAALRASPDLRAGTVQDGVARGVGVALEETLSLCAAEAPCAPAPIEADEAARPLSDKELRKRRDWLVASGGARIRFSRKQGVTLIARADGVVVPDCIRFEDRSDIGDLDGFVPAPLERPRLFAPNFLRAVEYVESPRGTRLRLSGRLGRRPDGYPCTITFEGRPDAKTVRMVIVVHNRQPAHRLRIRLLGIEDAVRHRGTPAWELVTARGRRFWAGTLVRACGSLRTPTGRVAVPDAQCCGEVRHEFLLGGGDLDEFETQRGWKRITDSGH